MSDEVTKPEESSAVEPVAVEIRKDVKQHLEDYQTDGTIRRKVVDHLTNTEIMRRTDMLVKAMDVRYEAEKELSKIKPDSVAYDEGGAKHHELFTKAKVDERKKCKEKLAKIDKAINKAINDADYDSLRKILPD